MGRRGPPPDPNSGRTRRGLNALNPQRRKNVIDLQPATGTRRASMPEWFHGHARAFWLEHAAELERLGTLSGATEGFFALVCGHYAHMREADAIIAQEGAVLTRRNGTQGQHPAARMQHQAAMRFMKLASEMGMTPVGRACLGVQDG